MSRKRKRRTTNLSQERVNEHLQENETEEPKVEGEEMNEEQPTEAVECCSQQQPQEEEEYCCCAESAQSSKSLAAPIFAGFVLVLLVLVAMSIVGYKKAIIFKNEIRQEIDTNRSALDTLNYNINAKLANIQENSAKQSSTLTEQSKGLESTFDQVSSQMDAKFAALTGNLRDVLSQFSKDNDMALAPIGKMDTKVQMLNDAVEEMKDSVLTANITSQRKSQLMQNAIAGYQSDIQKKLDAQVSEVSDLASSVADLNSQLKDAKSFLNENNENVISAVRQSVENNQKAVMQKFNAIDERNAVQDEAYEKFGKTFMNMMNQVDAINKTQNDLIKQLNEIKAELKKLNKAQTNTEN